MTRPPIRRLMIFAKAPEPGRVKTRLAPALGEAGAAALHAAFVRDVVARHRRPDRRLTVWRAGDLEDPLWAELDARLETQRGADLGARMRAAFTAELAGDARVVILGTDSPTLPPALVDEAFAALERVPAVLGPACDGGYYLLGLRGGPPPIFEDIAWGTESVLVETLRCIRRVGMGCHLLPFWYDVDRPADLELLRAHLAGPGVEPRPEHTVRLLTAQSGC